MPPLTPDQITAMAPDAASAKAGRGLAVARKWSLLGGDGDLLWGLVQGSGKDPYQTQILLAEPAFKCSCPSRKFPCKHGLALLYIAAEQPAAVTSKDRPPWVTEWLEGRAARADKAKQKEEKKAGSEGPDAAAQEKRREKRGNRVDEGADLLRQWLSDLIRRGIADAAVATFAFWEDMARRMVDAQANGLARRLRRAGEITRSGSGWEARLLNELGRLHLLLQAYAARADLDEALRAEVEQAVGWTVPTEQVLAGPGVADEWFSAAQTVVEDDRLIIATTWLFGAQQGRWAEVSTVSPVHQRVVDRAPLGAVLRGELAFYPGTEPRRAMFKAGAPTVATGAPPPVPESFQDVLTRHARSLATNPWRTRTPFLAAAQPGELNGRPVLVDAAGAALPLRIKSAAEETLLALTGGRPVPLCGLWDGDAVEVLAAAAGADWISLTGGVAAS